MKKLSVILLIILLCFTMLSACSVPRDVDAPSSGNHSSEITSTTTGDSLQVPSETDTGNETTGSTEVPTTESGTDKPEITAPVTTTPCTSETVPPTSETTSKPTETNPPETSSTTTPDTSEPAYIPSNALSVSFRSYESVNEAKPYLKGEAIYSVLYNGVRAQVGDTLVFDLSVSPFNHGDTVFVSATDNLSCVLSGNQLMVTVSSNNDISTGRITVYSAKDERSPVSASAKLSFVIDNAKDLTLIGRYITVKGMSNTDVAHGYTSEDPSLSITGFEGAPVWDDEILKSDPDWKAKCFWLIDQYASRGFTKVSFIEATASFGFSATK